MNRSIRTVQPRFSARGAVVLAQDALGPAVPSLVRSLDLRALVVAGVILTYVWRLHDLTPGLSALRLAALFTLSSWGFLLVAPKWPVLRRALSLPYLWLFLLWSAWMAVGIPFALSTPIASELVRDHLKTVTMVLLLVGFFGAFRHIRFVVAVQLFGAAVLTFFFAKSGFPSWGITPVSYYDRNDLAAVLVMIAPLAFFVGLTTRERWLRAGAWTLLLGIGASVILGQSRGGFLGLAATVTFLLLRLDGIRLWARILPPMLVILGVLLAPPESKERLGTLFSLEEDYNLTVDGGRIAVWKRGLGYMRDHPIIGLGRGNFPVAEGTLAPRARQGDPTWTRRSAAHNSFLEVGAETGLVGGLLYVSMILTAFLRLARKRREFQGTADSHSPVLRQFCDCLSASFIGFAVAGFFLSQGYYAMIFSLVSMVAGLELTTSGIGSNRASRSVGLGRNHRRQPQRVPARVHRSEP